MPDDNPYHVRMDTFLPEGEKKELYTIDINDICLAFYKKKEAAVIALAELEKGIFSFRSIHKGAR
jgi:hypothetical protein